MKPFLILQLRPETDVSDNEYEAILSAGNLDQAETQRFRLDQDTLPDDLDPRDFAGVIVGGGPGCVSDPPDSKSAIESRMEDNVLSLMPAITTNDIPFMGCCYGIGILAHHLGATVSKACYSEEAGPVDCRLTEEGRNDPLLRDFPENFMALVGHKEAVQDLPAGCVNLVTSKPCPFQMIRHKNNVYATQFHPEADGHVFEMRINVYRDHGYFDPGDADALIALCHRADVFVPRDILRRFVKRFRC